MKIASRAVVIRKQLKVNEKPSKQLGLLGGEESRYDYQVIATNNELSPWVSGGLITRGPAVRISSRRGFTATDSIPQPSMGRQLSVV